MSKGTLSHVAVTGGGGFIGASIVRELMTQGVRVTTLAHLPPVSSRIAEPAAVRKIYYDRMTDRALWSALSDDRPDCLIHCAWRGIASGDRDKEFQMTENVPMTVQTAELAVELGIKRWVGLGSQAEYGAVNGVVSENHPTAPRSLYGKAKLAAGTSALAICARSGICASWVRVFSTYGPHDAPWWFIPYIISEFGSGRAPKLTPCEQAWDYLYVEDAARAIVGLIRTDCSGVFNLGSGRPVTLRSVVQLVQAELGVTLKPEYGAISYSENQIMHMQADISRLRAATGWEPGVSLAEGIAETVKHAKGNLFRNYSL